jgi:hypothetical protein
MLNGWTRLGIVVSIAWVLSAGWYTLARSTNAAISLGSRTTLDCEGFYSPNGPHYSAACDKAGSDAMNIAIAEGRLDAAMIGLIPVPFGWGLAYLVLFLVRWVKRGFLQPPQITS